jgi:putative hydrolase of the HAD superfamily
MIETAIELTEGAIPADDIAEIIDWGKRMLTHPVELVDGVEEALRALARRYELILITKGDLFDQESRLARSGLAERFAHVEIVSEKDEAAYRRLLHRRRLAPHEFLMVGDSMRADVMPALRIGARAVHVPYPASWAHAEVEAADMPSGAWRLANIAELPGLLETFDE